MTPVFSGLGIVYEDRENLDKALEMYEKAVGLPKWNERYLNNLASVYYRKDDYDNAIKNYELILTLDYEFLVSYLEISLAYRLAGELEMGHAYLRKLAGMMDVKDLTDNDKNKDGWFYDAGDETVGLFSLDEKKQYTPYSLSMTLFLLGKEEDANSAAAKAQSMNTYQETSIKKLVRADLQRYLEKYPKMTGHAKRYADTYLGTQKE